MHRKRYIELKYICDKCGAYNHRKLDICGICKSTHIRKASQSEINETIILFENLEKNHL